MSRTAALRSALWVMVESWLVRLVSLVAFLVLARLLTPSDFGLMALAGIYLTFCSFVIDQGFGTALVQREDLQPSHLDAVFWAQIAIGLAIAALTFAAADAIAGIFQNPASPRCSSRCPSFPPSRGWSWCSRRSFAGSSSSARSRSGTSSRPWPARRSASQWRRWATGCGASLRRC